MGCPGDSGGEAASLREAPLPQTPSPEERLGFELAFLLTWFPLRVWSAPFQLVASTAADRAAADMQGKEYGDCEGGGFFARSPSLALPPEELWDVREILGERPLL